MKLMNLVLGSCVLSLGIASAASSYKVKVVDPTWVGQSELKPGEYQVTVENNKAVFKQGKNVVEVPAKLENSPSKFSATQLSTKTDNGHANLKEIDLGGTNSKIVFDSSSSAVDAGTR